MLLLGRNHQPGDLGQFAAPAAQGAELRVVDFIARQAGIAIKEQRYAADIGSRTIFFKQRQRVWVRVIRADEQRSLFIVNISAFLIDTVRQTVSTFTRSPVVGD